MRLIIIIALVFILAGCSTITYDAKTKTLTASGYNFLIDPKTGVVSATENGFLSGIFGTMMQTALSMAGQVVPIVSPVVNPVVPTPAPSSTPVRPYP